MSKTARIGAMRHNVIVEYTDHDQWDDFNEEESPVWKYAGHIRVSLEPLNGKELVEQRQIIGTVTHRVKSHYRPFIKPVMRLRKGDRVFNINSVVNVDEQNRKLLMMCTEVT